jgi:hypothetical protein
MVHFSEQVILTRPSQLAKIDRANYGNVSTRELHYNYSGWWYDRPLIMHLDGEAGHLLFPLMKCILS